MHCGTARSYRNFLCESKREWLSNDFTLKLGTGKSLSELRYLMRQDTSQPSTSATLNIINRFILLTWSDSYLLEWGQVIRINNTSSHLPSVCPENACCAAIVIAIIYINRTAPNISSRFSERLLRL